MVAAERERAEEREGGMPSKPTGMKTSGMPNLELIRYSQSARAEQSQSCARDTTTLILCAAQNNGAGCSFILFRVLNGYTTQQLYIQSLVTKYQFLTKCAGGEKKPLTL